MTSQLLPAANPVAVCADTIEFDVLKLLFSKYALFDLLEK